MPDISIYELNKQVVAGLPTLTEEQTASAVEEINKYAEDRRAKYFMLLGKEMSHYTLFNRTKNELYFSIGQEVVDVLQSLGEIKAIGLTEGNDAIEAWIVPFEQAASTLFMLFDYDEGVIVCQ